MSQVADSIREAVKFSRTQGILPAAAVSGSAVLGLVIFVASADLIRWTGTDAPLAFCVTALIYVLFILSAIQRSSRLTNGSFYAAAKSRGSAPRLFITGWLMLGGYLTLGALLALGAAVRLNLGLERLFGLNVGITLITFLLVGTVFVKERLMKWEGWKGRTFIFWTCALFLLVLVICAIFVQSRAGARIPKTEPMQHWLVAVSMLASSLWGIDMTLNYRDQFRRPNFTSLWSSLAVLCGGNILAALIAVVVLRNPSLMMHNWLEALTWNESRLKVLILVVGFLMCISGLMRVMTRITRILTAMIRDGALPYSKKHLEDAQIANSYYSALFCALLAFCASSLSVTVLLLNSGFAALLSMALYLQPLIKKNLVQVTRLHLPLHPLIPAVSIGLSIFLMWILPFENLFAGGLWLLAGLVVYVGHTRKSMLPSAQEEQRLAAQGVQPSAHAYRVLVYVDDDSINHHLIRIGSSIAAAKNGEMLVLRILETSELLPSELQQERGEAEWENLRGFLEKISLPGHETLPVVRMAPDPISGIRATSREFVPDFILVEWPQESAERLQKNRLQSLLQLTARPLGIFKGRIGEGLQKVSIACGGSDHAILALQIGEAISSANGSVMEAVRISTRSESRDAARDAMQKAIDQSGIRVPDQLQLHEDTDVEEGILKHAAGSDLLVLGASDDPLSGRLLADGQSMEIARQRKQASLIVKSKEESSEYFLRRVLSAATNRITALTPRERSELLGQLKVGLQGRADFYLMVALAAAIAITGLIMNDGSIVLGAMLVSPLMSPIVGIACGIALGNLDLMRRSGASTFKGMALVLGVGVFMTFVLPSVEPTDQILSRTRPGIFDLLAALAAGAAGAYSLSKKTVAGALPGVAMSLSLEPPLATAGYGLSTSQFWIAGGAFLLFLTNLFAIVLSGVGVYLLLGMRPVRKESLNIVSKSAISVILVVLILLIPLAVGTIGVVRRGHMKFELEAQFRTEAIRERFELLNLEISEAENGFLVHPTVLAYEEVTPQQVEKLRKALEERMDMPVVVIATVVQTKRIYSLPSNPKSNATKSEGESK